MKWTRGIDRSEWLALALLSPPAWSCCVAAGTRVRTPRGEVAVGSLVVGDRVESVEVATGRAVEGTIVAIRRAVRECLALRWCGGELVCTPDHPLYSPERGDYRPASDWITGDARLLLARTGETTAPVAVESSEIFASVHEVVDITLAAEPRNFVAAGVVVHNKSEYKETYDDDHQPATASVQGPDVTLTTTATLRKFRVRLCEDGGDPQHIGTLAVHATSSAAPQPVDGSTQWMYMTLQDVAGETTSQDDRVPGALDLSAAADWGTATCSVGFVVTFERTDDAGDGAIGVAWEVTFNSDSWGLGAPPELTIAEEP